MHDPNGASGKGGSSLSGGALAAIIAGAGAATVVLGVVLAVGVWSLIAPGDPVGDQVVQGNSAPASDEKGADTDDATDASTFGRSASQSSASVTRGTTDEKSRFPLDRQQLLEEGRASAEGLFVHIDNGNGSNRTAILATKISSANKTEGRSYPFPKGMGVPLPESFTGLPSLWRISPPREGERKLIENGEDYADFRLTTLKPFGTPLNRLRGRPGFREEAKQKALKRYDHRHLWSEDGKYLYVLSGTPPYNRLRKVNAHTWEIERQVSCPYELRDMAWCSQGLVAIVFEGGDSKVGNRSDVERKPWWQVAPPSGSRSLTLVLIDPETLDHRGAWSHPVVQEVAGDRDSDLVYLGTGTFVLVTNVKTGELLDVYRSDRNDVVHPQLTADGKWLVTNASQMVSRFGVSGPDVRYEETRRRQARNDGDGDEVAKLVDLGVGGDYLCVANRGAFDVVPVNDLGKTLGSLSVDVGSGVAMDPRNKAIYLCGLDTTERIFKLRMLHGDRDTEFVLARRVNLQKEVLGDKDPGRTADDRTRLLRQIRDVNDMLWPIDMSVDPTGRGVIVFVERAAYWVEPKTTSATGQRWPFERPDGQTVADKPPASDMPAGGELGQEEVDRLGSAATALVILPSDKGPATAFCVDDRGLFATFDDGLLSLGAGYQLSLVLQAGQLRERTVRASVLRVDPDSGLVLLKLATPADLQALELGDDATLVETAPLTAFGFPARAASAKQGQYPGVDARQGVVTSLREVNGELEAIQFDGRLVPGSSGGPAINARGQVVGIVQVGIVGADLNFLVPVRKLRKLLQPEIRFLPPALTRSSLREPVTFEARATSFLDPDTPMELELRLAIENGPRHSQAMRPADGVYRASLTPLAPESDAVSKAPFSIDFSVVAKQGGREVARVADTINIGPAGTRIAAPQLARNRVEIPLPAAVADVAVGGAGRWLILHLPDSDQLAIFDVAVARIVHRISVTEKELLFAASLDKLVVILPQSNAMQRWDLPRLELEETVEIPVSGAVMNVSMGSGSQGPLLVRTAAANGQADWTWIDPGTFEASPVFDGSQSNVRLRGKSARESIRLRASGNGQVYGIWQVRSSPSGLNTLVLGAASTEVYSQHASVGYVVPSPDGERVYTTVGVFSEKTETVGNVPKGMFFLPAHHGDYFLGMPASFVSLAGGMPQEATALYFAGDARPIVRLPALNYKALAGLDKWARSRLTLDKRVHLLPDAGLIITLPKEDNRLVLHRFDTERGLDVEGPTPAPLAKEHVPTSINDAVALVVLPSREGFGSSFCVQKRGYFVTNAHVVGSANAKPTLVVHAGEPNERLMNASVVRFDNSADLALLKVDQPMDLVALDLGNDDSIAKGQRLTAYGYPFGDALAVEEGKFPKVSVNVGPVVELRRDVMGRESIEFETQVNPGNSGGPVLNAENEVVGVVFATKVSQRESFAIPVSRLKELLKLPEIPFAPPTLTRSKLRESTRFEAHAI